MKLYKQIIICIFLSCSLACVFIEDKEEVKIIASNPNCFLYQYNLSDDSNFSGMTKDSWFFKRSIPSNFEKGIDQAIQATNQECRRSKDLAEERDILIKVNMTLNNSDEMVELKKNVLVFISAASLFLIPHWADYYYDLTWKIGAGTKCEKTFSKKEQVTLYIGIVYLFVPWKWDSAIISAPIESKFYKQTSDVLSEYEIACNGKI
ncbi:hypothetical protein [Leptospira kmetyi]|uniref:Lipoprotein n=1 Tax=Leptospira kmetyi TaxID=408139 RepID=A0ABX4N5E0_9LEPT|nr:hypothetical protein [Leptospira kmetyi]PJZ28405.1 hypothetical protein CH378_18200 [Leptospira kmetyi]